MELASEHINSALQAMLDSDPANKRFVTRLNDVRIKIHCTQPEFSLVIEFTEGHMSLLKPTDNEPEVEAAADLQLTGTAINLIKLATTPIENASGLRNSSISINGDVGLLLELSQVAKMIDIDWELLLAERIGETPAVVISRTIRAGIKEARKLRSELFERFTERMQSEKSPLPNKSELGELKSDLRDLNYRLDRLEATRKMANTNNHQT